MAMMTTRLRAHLEGEGGIRQLLSIALPMFISQAADTLMMFVDRLFLARLGKEHIAAAMGGGLTCFVTLTFFLGVIGYGNALVAQYLGSGRRERCGAAGAQGLVLALASYPLVLAIAPAALWWLRAAGHAPLQLELETAYFRILVYFSFLSLLRGAIGSFFSGIGRTRVVMGANVVAMVVNIVFNYLLIFGHWGFPALGMRGAAYGTVIGSGVGVLILVAAYFAPENRRRYGTWRSLRFEPRTMARLVRFGLPSGVELFLNLAAFNVFVQLMHSYGADVAAAVTIAFNWDMVAFIPMIGVSIATTSLVGRYMGAGRPETAQRAAYSGLRTALCYTTAVMALFVSVPGLLVGVFAPEGAGLDYSAVVPQAVFMVRLASVYLVSDAVMLVFGGALRGAGDTRWVMAASVACHWCFASVSWLQIRVLGHSPQAAWCVFVAMVTLMGAVFFTRFRGGKWKLLKVIEEDPRPEAVLLDVPEVAD